MMTAVVGTIVLVGQVLCVVLLMYGAYLCARAGSLTSAAESEPKVAGQGEVGMVEKGEAAVPHQRAVEIKPHRQAA